MIKVHVNELNGYILEGRRHYLFCVLIRDLVDTVACHFIVENELLLWILGSCLSQHFLRQVGACVAFCVEDDFIRVVSLSPGVGLIG